MPCPRAPRCWWVARCRNCLSRCLAATSTRRPCWRARQSTCELLLLLRAHAVTSCCLCCLLLAALVERINELSACRLRLLPPSCLRLLPPGAASARKPLGRSYRCSGARLSRRMRTRTRSSRAGLQPLIRSSTDACRLPPGNLPTRLSSGSQTTTRWCCWRTTPSTASPPTSTRATCGARGRSRSSWSMAWCVRGLGAVQKRTRHSGRARVHAAARALHTIAANCAAVPPAATPRRP